MTDKEIVQALRCCADYSCNAKCPAFPVGLDCREEMHKEVLALLERMTAENAALREKQRWIPVTEPPKEWKDEKTGYMINYLINCVYSGVDVGSYHAEAGCWLCRGLPVTVTHWMPMPGAPEEGEKA